MTIDSRAGRPASLRRRAPRLGHVLEHVLHSFGPLAFRLSGLVVIIVALVRRNVRVALFLLVSVELCGLITETAKRAADARAPHRSGDRTVDVVPVGHALGVMVGVLALLTSCCPVRRPLRAGSIALGAIVVLASASARVALNVHHLSDVVAGWALGYPYFACACWCCARGASRQRTKHRQRPIPHAEAGLVHLVRPRRRGRAGSARRPRVKLNSGTRSS